jgi:hypothetical protein
MTAASRSKIPTARTSGAALDPVVAEATSTSTIVAMIEDHPFAGKWPSRFTPAIRATAPAPRKGSSGAVAMGSAPGERLDDGQKEQSDDDGDEVWVVELCDDTLHGVHCLSDVIGAKGEHEGKEDSPGDRDDEYGVHDSEVAVRLRLGDVGTYRRAGDSEIGSRLSVLRRFVSIIIRNYGSAIRTTLCSEGSRSPLCELKTFALFFFIYY